MHEPTPVASPLYRPIEQLVHTALLDAWATFEYRPTPHAVHTAAEDAPGTLAYDPRLQEVHAGLAVNVLYVPTT